MSRPSSIISNETLSRIIHIESAGNPRAKARTSSASGLGQFITTTWLATVQKYRPDWMEGKTRQEVLNLRFSPKHAIEMLARYTEENAAILPGVKDADGDLYLAHFSGVGVAKRLLQAPGSEPCSRYFSSAAVAANRSILEGKSVGQVRAWAERKMRNAGGHRWVEKYWDGEADDEVVEPLTAVPREVDPENEWTYEGMKPETSGVSKASQGGFWATVMATVGLIWEKIQEAPESILALIVGLAQKPSFWFVVALGGVFAYIWYRKRQADKEVE